MTKSECPHQRGGMATTKVYWLRGTLYAVCRLCGADLRDRVDEAALAKLN